MLVHRRVLACVQPYGYFTPQASARLRPAACEQVPIDFLNHPAIALAQISPVTIGSRGPNCCQPPKLTTRKSN